MTIEKKYLELFFATLQKTTPVLADARVRDAFIKKLTPEVQSFFEDRKKIFETFCIKDDKDKPVIENGNFTFDPSVYPELEKELLTLLKETVEISVPKEIKSIIQSTSYGFKTGEVEIFDELIKCLN